MENVVDFYDSKVKVAIGTDHGGFEMKKELIKFLEAEKIDYVDYGPMDFDAEDDYCDFGAAAAKAVMLGECNAAILICRSGAGMNIVANRFHGVRSVVALDCESAAKSRNHNNSNCLVLAGDKLDNASACEIVKTWISTPYSKDARHTRRLVKLEKQTYDDIAAIRAKSPHTNARSLCFERSASLCFMLLQKPSALPYALKVSDA